MRKIQFLGKMPDPFKLADGTQMTKEQWLEKRDEIRNMIVDIEYGGMPPRPEYVEFERINVGAQITAGVTVRFLTDAM